MASTGKLGPRLVAAGGGAGPGGGPVGGARDAASRFKAVARNLHSTGFASMPSEGPANPYPSETNAGGFKRGGILDANPTSRSSGHGLPSDVDVMLSHGG